VKNQLDLQFVAFVIILINKIKILTQSRILLFLLKVFHSYIDNKLLLFPNKNSFLFQNFSKGGSAQNSSRICQQILTSKIGPESIYFIGSIGRDKTGKILEESVKSSKVKTLYYYHSTESTGITAGLVTSDTNRTLMANIGASAKMPIEFLETDPVLEAIKNSVIHFSEAYFVTHSPMAVMSLAKLSLKYSKNFFLSLSAPYVVIQHFEELMHLMPFSDAIFANISEAQTFYTQLTGSKSSDIELIARTIVKIEKSKPSDHLWNGIKRCVFITQGPNPVIVAKWMTSGEVEVKSFPIPHIEVKGDTIGAGDAFVGGVVAHLLCGKSIDESVVFGIDIATKTCQNRGCVLKD